VDELADLMLTVQGRIETPLAVLAQKARAIRRPPDPRDAAPVGERDHRPHQGELSLPQSRFACRPKSTAATILDQNGARNAARQRRHAVSAARQERADARAGGIHSTDETEKLMEWYKAHARKTEPVPGKPSIDEQVAALEEAAKAGAKEEGWGGSGERDPLFRPAAEVCIQNQLGSTSLLHDA